MTVGRGLSRRTLMIVGLLCLIIAGVVSLWASAAPDGLEQVAHTTGFAETAKDSATATSPLADYQFGNSESNLSRSLAGVVGVLLTGALGIGLFLLVTRKSPTKQVVAATVDAPRD